MGGPRRRYWDGQRWTDEFAEKELAVLGVPRGAVLVAGLVGVLAVAMAIQAMLIGEIRDLIAILVGVVLVNSFVLGVPWLLSRSDKRQKQRQQARDQARALAINAEREYKAYLDGDDHLGTYGQFPPPPELLEDDR